MAVQLILLFSVAAACSGTKNETVDRAPSVKEASPLSLEVVSVGLGGRILSNGGNLALKYRVLNSGPEVRVHLKLFSPPSVTAPYNAKIASVINNIPPQEVEAIAKNAVEGTWYISENGLYYAGDLPGQALYLTAEDPNTGVVLAATKLPAIQAGTQPIVIVAQDKARGLAVESAIRLAAPDTGGVVVDVFSVVQHLPTAWFEYETAARVLLARPLSSLATAEREALYKWVVMGGELWISPEDVPDWTDEDFEAWNSGTGKATAVSSLSDKALTRPVSSDWNIEASAVMQSRYELPPAALLIVALVLIVIIAGPVLHLVCARIGKRELIWIAAPAFSIAAAMGMYGLAQAVKGDESAVELHHLLVSGGRGPSMLTSTVRVQTATQGMKQIVVTADAPHPQYGYFNFSDPNSSPPKVALRRFGLSVRSFTMHKWSTRDFSFRSVGESFAVGRIASNKGEVTLENRGSGALDTLYYLDGNSWYQLRGSLPAAATKYFVYSSAEFFSDSGDNNGNPIRELLYTLRNRYADTPMNMLASSCALIKPPKAVVYPTPAVSRSSAHCVFLFRNKTKDGSP